MAEKLKNASGATEEVTHRIFTLANIVSFVRLLMVPAYLVLLLNGYDLAATLVFAVAAATDFLDGQIARRTHTVSRLGQLLDPAIRAELFTPARPIRAKGTDKASTYVGPEGVCVNSLVGEGCRIEGVVENSILFRGVSVAKGAEVKNCILMQDAVISRDAVLHHVIADKNVAVMDDRTLMGHENCPLVIAKDSKV